ncbi:MAG: hypothetical protein J0I09_07410 [Sphingobacteriia bacterium]|nr:hypothetical protein [Sphingobacteriia bacterium]
MKRILIIAAIISPITFLSSSSCKKSTQPDCGCDAPIKTTISDTSNLIGTIEYNKYYNSNDNFKNKFTIVYVERNCSNCIHTMVICNQDILPQRVLDLKQTNQSLQVKFAGDLKQFCEKIIAPGDYTYEYIILTKIIVQ